jgi:hypothetical protein
LYMDMGVKTVSWSPDRCLFLMLCFWEMYWSIIDPCCCSVWRTL